MLGWLVGQEPAPSKCVFLSTSAAGRKDMRNWLISDGGDRWSVKLDVRDLGGHLDVTYRSWGCTLAARVREVLRVVCLVSALSLSRLLCMVLRLLFSLRVAIFG